MRFARIALIMIFWVAGLVACQATAPSSPISPEPVIQTDSTGTIPDETTTQTLVPASAQEDTNMTPVTPPDAAAENLVALVKQHLAQQLGIPADQIALSDVKPVVWRDAGLGCAKPGVDYIQVETPGYNILLEASGKTYRYHTDATKRFVPCNK